MVRQAVLSGLLLFASLQAEVIPGRFIVELAEPPLGSLARTPARSPEKAARSARILSSQRAASRAVEGRGRKVVSTLSSLMNGIVVQARPGDESWLSSLPGAVKVYPVDTVELHLDHALPLHSVPAAWDAIGGRDKAGAGIKIGVLDSGISPDHPGFQAPALPIPAGFPLASPEGNLQYTNSKIIVARDYSAIYQVTEPDDVRDRNGHGTAVAMCAAGVTNEGPWGTITGVAPAAWIGAYKISPLATGTSTTDVITKAVDDAVADGMDVINLSSGSALVRPYEDNPAAVALDRATRAGVIVVVSAGNYGPSLATVGNFASIPSVIAVGASENDRLFGPGVEVTGLAARVAIPRSGALPDDSVAGTLKDIQSVEANSTACTALPEGSLKGQIALLTAAGCLFETKLRNLENAGAVAAVLYVPVAGGALFIIGPGQATLPAVLVGFEDGAAFRTAAANDSTAKISFRGIPFVNNAKRLRTSSSRGPTYSYQIKPDLAATGYVYTAAQKLNDKGEEYSASGYIATSGTSFSSPVVAGAAAVLKGSRPGLTLDQYRSLLINRASPLDVAGSGLERIQRTGNGTLDLASSLGGTVAAYPTSLSFGIGGGTVERVRELRLTNLGKAEDSVTLGAIRYDDAAPPAFADNQGGQGALENYTLTLGPGESKTIYAHWKTKDVAAGEYQGVINIQNAAGSGLLVPYWYGVPSNAATSLTVVQAAPLQLDIGQSASIYLRAIDASGIAVSDIEVLKCEATVTAGGGTISAIQPSGTYPNLVFAQLRPGTTAGRNTYRIACSNLPPQTFTLEGRQP